MTNPTQFSVTWSKPMKFEERNFSGLDFDGVYLFGCRVMKPDPRGRKDFTIADPACGTGGFLICAYEWLVDESKGVFDRSDAKRIRSKTYFGQDLVARPRRLALMNLYLHGVEPHIYLGDTLYEPDRGERYDVVLTNPPFGTAACAGTCPCPDRTPSDQYRNRPGTLRRSQFR